MKEFIDKLIERLEEEIQDVSESQRAYEVGSDVSTTYSHIMGVLRDVKNRIIPKVAEEYKGGWIPCERELPKDDKYVLVTFAKDRTTVGWYDGVGKSWYLSLLHEYRTNDVTAWMPLPAPYTEGE